jgi:hypothetical protein
MLNESIENVFGFEINEKTMSDDIVIKVGEV